MQAPAPNTAPRTRAARSDLEGPAMNATPYAGIRASLRRNENGRPKAPVASIDAALDQ